mmetsp:Transcript_15075/g.41445  ORF Transcript_15075/g.41445 Transcript_15075/m.41445 type:complete len:220 (-) Transcript_15075:731-1390(-)
MIRGTEVSPGADAMRDTSLGGWVKGTEPGCDAILLGALTAGDPTSKDPEECGARQEAGKYTVSWRENSLPPADSVPGGKFQETRGVTGVCAALPGVLLVCGTAHNDGLSTSLWHTSSVASFNSCFVRWFPLCEKAAPPLGQTTPNFASIASNFSSITSDVTAPVRTSLASREGSASRHTSGRTFSILTTCASICSCMVRKDSAVTLGHRSMLSTRSCSR